MIDTPTYNYLRNTVVFIEFFKLVEQSMIVRLGFLSLVDVVVALPFSPTMKSNSFLGSNLHFFHILLKYGFCKKSLPKDKPLTSRTLF